MALSLCVVLQHMPTCYISVDLHAWLCVCLCLLLPHRIAYIEHCQRAQQHWLGAVCSLSAFIHTQPAPATKLGIRYYAIRITSKYYVLRIMWYVRYAASADRAQRAAYLVCITSLSKRPSSGLSTWHVDVCARLNSSTAVYSSTAVHSSTVDVCAGPTCAAQQ